MKKNLSNIISLVALCISFLIIIILSSYYIKYYTYPNTYEISDKSQLINSNFILIWFLGIILFAIHILLSKNLQKEFLKSSIFYLFEIIRITIISAALILSISINNLKGWFIFILFVSGLIMFYILELVEKYLDRLL